MRRLGVLLVCCCVGLTFAPGAVAPAAGGSPGGSTGTAPQQLVHAYPLGPQRLCCRGNSGGSRLGTQRQQRASTVGRPNAARSSSGSSSLGWIALLAVVALLVGVLTTVVIRRRPKVPAAEPGAPASTPDAPDAVPVSSPRFVPPGRYVVDARPSVSATSGPTPGWSSNTLWHSGRKPRESRTDQERSEGTAALELEYRRGDGAGDAGAAFNLGVLLHSRGDLAGAVAAYLRAEERGDGDAAFNLGVLLYEAGDLDGAETAWRRCVERRDARAAANLGYLLQRRGDLEGALLAHADAERWSQADAELEFAPPTEDASEGAMASAAAGPGSREREQEVSEGTAALELEYRRGDGAGDAGAAFNLGVLLHSRGDLAGAVAAYLRAEERGDGDAAFNLGVLLYEAGDLDGAETAWRRCVERRDARAAANLGYLLQRRGDLEGALLAHAYAERWSKTEAAEMTTNRWDPDPVTPAAVADAGNRSRDR